MAPSASHTVKVLELCRVAPPPDSVTETSLPLTFFDLLWLTTPSVEHLLFYDFPHSKTHFTQHVLPLIKHSLSLTLQHFYPLAGNLSWSSDADKPSICYVKGDSVSLTIAESNHNFQHLVTNYARDVNNFHPLVPLLTGTDTLTSILALQITLFPGHGSCIGFTLHHGVADGSTAAHFMRSWTSTYKSQGGRRNEMPSKGLAVDLSNLEDNGNNDHDQNVCKSQGDKRKEMFSQNLVVCLPTPNHEEDNRNNDQLKEKASEVLPFFDRSVIMDPLGLEKIYLKDLTHFKGSLESLKQPQDIKAKVAGMVRATFVLTPTHVKRLNQLVSTLMDKKGVTPFYLSTFVLVNAYVLVCLTKARGSGESEKKNIQIGFATGCRTRLNHPIPTTYFGNCIGVCWTKEMKRDLIKGEDGFLVAAEGIGKAIQDLESGVLRGAEKWVKNNLSSHVSTQRILIAGTLKLSFYGIDFGWGKPRKSEVISAEKKGSISLSQSRDGDGGVEVELALTVYEMEVFSSLFVNGLKDLE